jgi:anti-sigma B factor antagonist
MTTFEIFLASSGDGCNGQAQLVLKGELDIATAPAFAEKLDEACEDKPAELRIDLTKVTFIDSSGLREFVRAAEACARNDTKLKIVGACRLVHQGFVLTGLGDEFFFD